VPLVGDASGTAWDAAATLRIDRRPWDTGGVKQGTAVRVMYDRAALYVQFRCRDRHIYAVETKLNGSVYKDSCVEMFAMPHPAEGAGYFNLEINCCGCMHLGWGPGRPDRKLVTPDLAAKVRIASAVPPPTKDESPDDNGWWIAAAVPFDTLSEFTGVDVHPTSGNVWHANFYRCGGLTDQQYAVWNPIAWPHPDYHRPEFFGTLKFA
jgi:hypothetical protein